VAKSLLNMLERLKASESSLEKSEISNELLDFALKETKFSESLLKSHLIDLLKEESGQIVNEIADSDFFKSRLKLYYDENNQLKITFGLSFLQDLGNFESNLENDIILLIDEIVHRINLDFIINDINVNSLQIRNGEFVISEG